MRELLGKLESGQKIDRQCYRPLSKNAPAVYSANGIALHLALLNEPLGGIKGAWVIIWAERVQGSYLS